MNPGFIIAISLFAVSISGQAATLSLESCAAMEDPVERLACYDTLAGRLNADTAKANSAAPGAEVISGDNPVMSSTAPAVEPTPDAEAIFGLEHKQKQEGKLPDKLQLKWTSKEKDAYGKWIVTLENGQVWHQTDSVRFRFVNPEQWVVISRGLLNSFFLGEPGRNGSIRVKRVR
jgi:hypothetical protein